MNKILLAPTFISDQGIGHVKRSRDLLDNLRYNTFLYIPHNIDISEQLRLFLPTAHIIRSLDPNQHWDIVLIDRRRTSENELRKFYVSRTIIGLDEGGKSRRYIPYLMDSPLNPFPRVKPNALIANHHNNFSSKKQHSPSIKKVLISFGGEDIQSLSSRLLALLINKNIFLPEDITIIQGPLFQQVDWPSGVTVLINEHNVADLIPRYDLVFTHFGMTCFESALRNVPVILLNPSVYHQKLGMFHKFPCIGIKKPVLSKLKKILAEPDTLYRSIQSIREGMKKTILPSELIQSFRIQGTMECPVCGKNLNPVIERFLFRSYFCCRSCQILYAQIFNSKQGRYDKNYFFREYSEHYGKTYIEDFNHIKEDAHRRLSIIKKITGSNMTLLDIGCAYGPFLLAAKEERFMPEGIDISGDACSYVNDTLHIPCTCLDFSIPVPEKEIKRKYDIITMWYVLEHFIKTDVVLKKVNRYLRRGGIFAFSTPNISGISFKKNKKDYLEKNPEDHFTLWNPHIAGKVLGMYGFKIKKIRITGHHPERFPFIKSKKKSLLFFIVLMISKVFRLGDTFEVYAQKVEEVV